MITATVAAGFSLRISISHLKRCDYNCEVKQGKKSYNKVYDRDNIMFGFLNGYAVSVNDILDKVDREGALSHYNNRGNNNFIYSKNSNTKKGYRYERVR